MILLVDIGNSRVKWAELRDGRMIAGLAMTHRDCEPVVVWETLWAEYPAPQRILIATVASAVLGKSLAAWVKSRWSLSVEFVHTCSRGFGVTNGYRQPETLGVDRWLTLIGARQLPETWAQHLCIIDCGTAMTADILTAEGQHLGGWIAPGLGLMRQQLVWETAALEGLVECQSREVRGFGNGTLEGMLEGTRQAAVGFVAQALTVAQTVIGQRPKCLMTGGDADALRSSLPADTLVLPDLVLRGLAVVASATGRQAPK